MVAFLYTSYIQSFNLDSMAETTLYIYLIPFRYLAPQNVKNNFLKDWFFFILPRLWFIVDFCHSAGPKYMPRQMFWQTTWACACYPSLGRCLPQALHQGGTGLRVSLCQFPPPGYRYPCRLRRIPPLGYRCDRRLHYIIEKVIGLGKLFDIWNRYKRIS